MPTLYDILHTLADRVRHHTETDREELHAAIASLADDDQAADDAAAPTDTDQDGTAVDTTKEQAK